MDSENRKGKHSTKKARKKKKTQSQSSEISPSAKQPEIKRAKTQLTMSVMTSDCEEESESGSESDDSELAFDLKILLTEVRRELKGLKQTTKEVNKKQDIVMDKLKEMDDRISGLDIRMAQQGKAINLLQNDFGEIKEVNNITQKRCIELEKAAEKTEHSLYRLQEQTNKLERKSREKNLRIVGYPEPQRGVKEDCIAVVKSVLASKMGLGEVPVDTAHRVGPHVIKNGRHVNRHIIFRLQNIQDKHEVMKRKRDALKDEAFYIIDDLTEADLDLKKRLKPVTDKARAEGKTWKFRAGKLIIEGQVYKGPVPNTSDKLVTPARDLQGTPAPGPSTSC